MTPLRPAYMPEEAAKILGVSFRQVKAAPMPEGELPATLAEMLDEQGRLPALKWSPPQGDDMGLSIARHQWVNLSGVRYAALHPKGR